MVYLLNLASPLIGDIFLFLNYSFVYTKVCYLSRTVANITNPYLNLLFIKNYSNNNAKDLKKLFYSTQLSFNFYQTSLKKPCLLNYFIDNFNLCFLKNINSQYCNLKFINSPLPENLIILDLSHNCLKFLPDLPNNLIELYCNDNNIINLPNLPNSLEILDCDYNDITIMPKLPKSIKKVFYIHNPIQKF